MPRKRKMDPDFKRQYAVFKFPEKIECEICGKEVKYDPYTYCKGLVDPNYVYDTTKILDTMSVGDTEYNLYALKHLTCRLNERKSSSQSN